MTCVIMDQNLLNRGSIDYTLLNEGNYITTHFMEECSILSSIHHPSIVQFFHICCLKGATLNQPHSIFKRSGGQFFVIRYALQYAMDA